MERHLTLDDYLARWRSADRARTAVAAAVEAVAAGAAAISRRIARGPFLADLGAPCGANAGGDVQTNLDIWANDRLIARLREAPVAAIASEELDVPLDLDANAPIAVAIDPLDGSSNIDTNVAIGTIFSILPAGAGAMAAFLQPGRAQLAAGYVIYGPRCVLMLSVGEGTAAFTLDPEHGAFRLTAPRVAIKPDSGEYAINASNYRHWSPSIRAYVDDCVEGGDGPRGRDVNMRWIASLVAECHRILARGGVFLYPRDERKGYENGRLRLLYEANPIAFLVEQAGGRAFDGRTRILDLTPTAIHQRTPLIFGSETEIERIARYKIDPSNAFERSALFGRRGLFRA